MQHTVVTYTVKPGREQENAALVRGVFENLDREQPSGFRYAVFQLGGTRQFVHIYTNDGAPSGALQGLPAFKAFIADAADRHEHAATFSEAELIGDYLTLAPIDDPAPDSA